MRVINSRLCSVAALAVLGLALVSLGGCAAGGRPAQMTLATGAFTPTPPGGPGYQSVRVARVEGGGKTNPLWISSVSSEDFKTALESSLKAVGLLAEDPSKATIDLNANLVDLKRPMAGLDMSVTTSVHYAAQAAGRSQPVLEETVSATGTAKFGEALLGVERLQKANEAAVRENIASFIRRFQDALAKLQTVAAAGQ